LQLSLNLRSLTNMIKKETSKLTKVVNLSQFFALHLIPLCAYYTGVNTIDWIVCGAFYITGMFFITAGYHRYFSHRTFKLNRFWQFIFAFMAQTTAQKGALWWASHHRLHHKHSDTEKDIHSQKRKGFWYSHVGWVVGSEYNETDYNLIKDFAKYPELVWLNKYHLLIPWIVGVIMFIVGGASMLFIGFFLSLVFLWHCTFTINSLSHMIGNQRYATGDESKNNWFLALITLGEGWHNNHHHYMHSARQGFFWYEYDISFYILKLMSWLGIVKDIRPVPNKFKYSSGRTEVKLTELPTSVQTQQVA
jgi:stearoyl-CoA desaturase (Delta-9 desaturase)